MMTLNENTVSLLSAVVTELSDDSVISLISVMGGGGVEISRQEHFGRVCNI